MKRSILFLSILFTMGIVAQAQENPFKKYGVKGEILTLSKGKYKEVFYNEEIMQVGTVKINTLTGKVVEFLEPDTTEFAYRAEVTSRFISVDPLCEEHYDWSPYAYTLNNPVRYIDPDGRLERDPNGNVKFYASGQTISRETVKYNGFSLTPNYSAGYVVTDKGNKVSADRLESVTVVSADGKRTSTFSASDLGKIGNFDFASNCHGLAMADGQVFVNDPGTILADEYTKVGQEKGANMDNVGNTKHDVVTVGVDALGTTNHSAKSDGKGTYTHKDNNTKVRTNEPVNRVVDLYGTGEASGLPVKELDIHLYKKNQ